MVLKKVNLSPNIPNRDTWLNSFLLQTLFKWFQTFLSEQCKEIEENNRMGKTRNFYKKIRDIKEHFLQWWTQWMDLTETEDIKKRWQEYTEELYKKDLHDSDNHDGVITHLEPDILECVVK